LYKSVSVVCRLKVHIFLEALMLRSDVFVYNFKHAMLVETRCWLYDEQNCRVLTGHTEGEESGICVVMLQQHNQWFPTFRRNVPPLSSLVKERYCRTSQPVKTKEVRSFETSVSITLLPSVTTQQSLTIHYTDLHNTALSLQQI